MKLQKTYEKEGMTYANFIVENKGLGIEYDKQTNKVVDLHFSIMIEIDNILEAHNYSSDENQVYYYYPIENVLGVPVQTI